MQSRLTILLLSACVVLFSQVQAACLCDASDTTCLQKCVNDGQSCVTACNGETTCYDQCIANYWPGQSVASSTVTSAPVVATSSSVPAMTSVAATTSVAASTSSAAAVATSVVQSASSVLAPVSSSSSGVVSSVSSSLAAAATSAASFTPTPPTSSAAPSSVSSSGQSTYLVPAVAIGVASVTVITQFFFLARMGSVLFN